LKLLALASLALTCLGARKNIDLKKLAKEYKDDDDDAAWATLGKKRKTKPTTKVTSAGPSGSDGLEEGASVNLNEIPGLENLGLPDKLPPNMINKGQPNNPGFDINKIMGGINGGMGGMGGMGGGNSMKAMNVFFKKGVCDEEEGFLEEYQREDCARELKTRFGMLLSSGGIPETMGDATAPWDRLIYVCQGAAIFKMHQMRTFFLDQAEVSYVKDDGVEHFPEGVNEEEKEERRAHVAEKNALNRKKPARKDDTKKQAKKKKKKKNKSKNKVTGGEF